MANKKIESLSGGEKSRLKLLVMISNGFNFLILDEPTNHLDIEFKEVFEDVLNEYEGTLLFISHDRYFINSVAERILEIDNQSIYDYEGNYEYYKEKKPKTYEEIKITNKIFISIWHLSNFLFINRAILLNIFDFHICYFSVLARFLISFNLGYKF